MPDRLKAVRDIRKPDYGDILLERARRIGPNALTWAETASPCATSPNRPSPPCRA